MWVKVLLGLCALSSICAISLDALPRAKVGAKNTKVKEGKNLVELAESLHLTTLVEALKETNLDSSLNGEGPFTLFAPTDEAFKNVPEWTKDVSMNELLKYHVSAGLIKAEDIYDEMLTPSLLDGRNIRFNLYAGVEDESVIVTANGSPISSADNEATNGIIHIIDRVMFNVYEKDSTIVKELELCPIFKNITKLIDLVGLGDALNGEGPYTLFAPTDEAFAALPVDDLEHLLSDTAALRDVLLYHVVNETYFSAAFTESHSYSNLDTLQGGQLEISVVCGKVSVNNKAKVIAPDAAGSNGVVHAIDSVLIPPAIKKKMDELAHKRTNVNHTKKTTKIKKMMATL